jgi:polysaccharide biosynthesis/export protein
VKKTYFALLFFVTFSLLSFAQIFAQSDDYKVGIGDILEVRILKPEPSTDRTTVTPSGQISVAYIGSLHVKDKTITEVQKEIQWRLASGYLKYPVVVVSLIESRSMNFTVSGEVIHPGSFQLQEKTTVLKAISMAGGFTRFGSKSRVKLLRPFPDKPGYDSIKINLQKAMNGDAREDIMLKPGDIVIVSEGFF